MIWISFKLKIRFRERTGYALGIEFYEGGWTSRARMLWKSSLWKALWGHCHRRLKTKIKFTIFRQLQPYGTFQGLLLPFHYVLSTFVQNFRFYRYLHSGLQYDIISQPRNGKLSELTWRVKLSEFAMLSEAWTYFTLGTMVIFHFSQCNERTHQLSAFPGIAVYEQKRAKRCVSSVQKCKKLHFREFSQDVTYVVWLCVNWWLCKTMSSSFTNGAHRPPQSNITPLCWLQVNSSWLYVGF